MLAAVRNSKYTPIGIDVRDNAVYAVQFRRVGSGMSLHAAGNEPIASNGNGDDREEAVQAALKGLLQKCRFAGRRAVTALPSHEVDTRPVTLPPNIKGETSPGFGEALMLEANSCLLYEANDAVINYLTLDKPEGEEEGPTEILLIACQKDVAFRHIAQFKAARIRVGFVDSGACAAVRLLGEGDSVFAVIELDETHCVVSIGRGKDLQFSRTIKRGMSTIVDAVAADLDIDKEMAARILKRRAVNVEGGACIDPDEVAKTGLVSDDTMARGLFDSCRRSITELAVEIRRSIDYFSGLRSSGWVKRAVLSGSVVPMGLDAFLSKNLNIPVSLANAFECCGEEGVKPEDCESMYALAAGLALREDL